MPIETETEFVTAADRKIIERLRPSQKDLVRHVVNQAHISTDNWRANDDPAFRSEWCFGDAPGPAVLMIDHVDLRAHEGTQPCFRLNMREDGRRIQQEAEAAGLSVSSVKPQLRRGQNFDNLLRRSCDKGSPLQVALVAGSMKKTGPDKRDRYGVDLRQLDTHIWRVVHYDVDTGNHLLVRTDELATPETVRGRGTLAAPVAPPAAPAAPVKAAPPVPVEPPAPVAPVFVDQFSLPDAARREEVTISRVRRDPAVRQKVLKRAGGLCELCGKPGFRTLVGSLYLETHHVVPLEEDGADAKWNVAAICAGEHREAHHGEQRDDIRQRLLDFLIGCYPDKADIIRERDRRGRMLRAQRLGEGAR